MTFTQYVFVVTSKSATSQWMLGLFLVGFFRVYFVNETPYLRWLRLSVCLKTFRVPQSHAFIEWPEAGVGESVAKGFEKIVK